MMTTQHREHWQNLEALLRGADPAGLHRYLGTLPPGETARAIFRLAREDQERLLTVLSPQQAAGLVVELPQAQAAELLGAVPPDRAAAILGCLPSDERADLLGELDTERAGTILANLPSEVAEDVRRLAQYPPETAGGLMITEYLAYPESARVEDIIADLRGHAEQYSRYQVQYAYITSLAGRLVGVLRLRDLLLSPTEAAVTSVMVTEPLRLRAEAPLDELARFFDRHPFFGAPVTDEEGRLLGVVLQADVEEALGERAERRFLLISGVLGGEEFRTMSWRVRLGRRLAWLGISLALNLLAAGVIGLYQETLAAVIALAVFLPVISGMGGNSGNQALAVSVRELALGLIQPHEFRWVLLKEAAVGVVNGLLLGALLGVLALVWVGNPYLGLVVGAAMTLSTLVAVCLGGTLPLALSRLGLDPAVAAGPILTTVTDTCGFFFTLALASGLLHQLAL
ncbi:MAG TPA: magnesium transporter [Gemmataceae bacterium]|nr:magnesium transporter [Gemmataceae bacterium]